MWEGWIICREDEIPLLRELGVEKGAYNKETMTLEPVELTEESFIKLDPYWGQFTWGLHKLVDAEEVR